jgi:hypothetical protein
VVGEVEGKTTDGVNVTSTVFETGNMVRVGAVEGGAEVGCSCVGCSEGSKEKIFSREVGSIEGDMESEVDGDDEGAVVGSKERLDDGAPEGETVGNSVVAKVGRGKNADGAGETVVSCVNSSRTSTFDSN